MRNTFLSMFPIHNICIFKHVHLINIFIFKRNLLKMVAFSQMIRPASGLLRAGIKYSGPSVRQSHGASTRPAFDVENFGDIIKKTQKHSNKTTHVWVKLFWFAMVPGTCLTAYLAWQDYLKEYEHLKHRKQEDYIAYPYLAIRTKPFPWGDGNKTLFHNPYTNWVPGVGYEKLLSEEEGKGKKH